MLDYTANEVAESLALASNPNSALKSFLKQEVQKGDPVAKFVKALKNVLAKNNKESLEEFVGTYHEKYQAPFFVISRYVHNQALGEIVESIIEQYAEEFNQSYTVEGEEISISNAETFEKIIQAALSEISSGLKGKELPETNFMKNLIIDWLFDEAVAKEVYQRAGGK